MKDIKKLICINIPMPSCNLKCHYCYITQQHQWGMRNIAFNYSIEHIAECLTTQRLGGKCLINLTGSGETMIPVEMPQIIRCLLQNGHYLEVVTNGTLTHRFEEIARIDKNLLKHLEFKFSFHYLELKKRNMIDVFFDNVKLMQDCGCSFTIEVMPNDELIPFINELKELCIEKVGALCQLTVGRDDTQRGKKILTKLPINEYEKIWGSFESQMFRYKISIFGQKRKEFCYAGMWSLYVDLATGNAKTCYGQPISQNIFEDPQKPIIFSPVGYYCRQPFCYNGHAFLALGVIPELKAPSYADIRNRVCKNRKPWFSDEMYEVFSSKLYQSNDTISRKEKLKYTFITPFKYIHCLWRYHIKKFFMK